MKVITIKTETVGDSLFYINEVFKNNLLSYTFNRVNEVTGRTYNYKSKIFFNKAIKRAKKVITKTT